MEQPRRTPPRPPQNRPRRTPPLPPQATGPGSGSGSGSRPGTVYRASGKRGGKAPRPVSPLVLTLRRFPNPRLTGLGSGLFCAATMLALAFLDALLFDGSIGVYGVLFVLVSALTAMWVRRADLVTAPVAVPIAFAVGILPVADGSGGLGGQLMGLVTALAMHAGWLYGGTLVAGLVVTVRGVRHMARRAARRRSLALARAGSPSGTDPATATSAPHPRRRTA
ncbi:DUF6542 domain-containing protein [Streptomyces antnestii]|uniref:DUF6542 domain-containing protein n=1 Tax=Streptomyces antnestii TaxID=2494256 RepID=UPI001CB96926|nr:DUF6542 domain-containing protein [Streptomyces sp. San01]